MAVYKRDMVDINLETGNIHRSFLKHSIGYKDAAADHFGIRVFRNGEPVDLTSVSIQGIFMPPQGSPIAITSGNIVSGNEAEVVLPQACYNYDGQFTLSIKLVDATNAVTGTMRIVDGMVDNTHASGTVAPTSAVPTYQEILATYDAMVAATTAATTAATNVGSIVAAAYSTSATYAVGDYCTKDGNLYRCTTAITTAESWTAAHWTQTKMGPDVSDLKSALGQFTAVATTQLSSTQKYNINSSGAIVSVSGVQDYGVYYAPIQKGKKYGITSYDTSGTYIYSFFESVPTTTGHSYNYTRYIETTRDFIAPIDGYVAFRSSFTMTNESVECETAVDITARMDFEDFTKSYKETVFGCDNGMVWTVGSLKRSDGETTYSATALRSNTYDYPVTLFCTTGSIEVFAYSESTYIGVWNGTTYSTDEYLFVNDIDCDLSDVVDDGYSYRIVYFTGKEQATVSDNSNVKIKDNRFDEAQNILDEKILMSVYGGPNELVGWKVGGINPATGSSMYQQSALLSDSHSDSITIFCTQGQIGVFAYNESTYVGMWDGTNYSKTKEFRFEAGKECDLSIVADDGYSYRIVYYTGKTSASVSDNKYVKRKTEGMDTIYDEMAIMQIQIDKNAVVRDLTNMAWCDRNDPVAVRYNHIRDQVYIGYVDNEGYQGIASYNLATGAIDRYIFRQVAADNHNGVSISILPDGKILCALAAHTASRMVTYVSTKPESISEWDGPVEIENVSGYNAITYNEFVKVGSTYYLFYRCIASGNEYWGVVKTTDGKTWTGNSVFLYGNGLKYYCVPAKYDDRYIKMFLNSNYSLSATEIRLGYIDTQTGNILNSDKTEVLGTLGNDTIIYTSFDVAIDNGNSHLQIFKALEGTTNAVLIGEYIGSASSTTTKTYVVIENNGSWTRYELPNPGTALAVGAANGAAFVDENNYIECRKNNSNWTLELCTLDNGVVSSTKTLLASPSADIVLAIPSYTDGYAIIQRGIYTTYTNYILDAVVKSV